MMRAFLKNYKIPRKNNIMYEKNYVVRENFKSVGFFF